MDFFGIGPWEVLLILIIVLLIFFGPGKLPEIARALGEGIRKFRMASREMTTTISKKISEETKEIKSELVKTGEEITDEVKDISNSLPLSEIKGQNKVQSQERK